MYELKLPKCWDECPKCWTNFVSWIHNKHADEWYLDDNNPSLIISEYFEKMYSATYDKTNYGAIAIFPDEETFVQFSLSWK